MGRQANSNTERSVGLQRPTFGKGLQLEKMKQARNLGLVIVEGDEKIKDVEKRNLQRPRVFYRREAEATPFVVGRK